MTTGTSRAAAEFAAHRAPGSPVVVLEGVVPERSRAVTYALSVHDPVRFLAAAFAEALLDAGITLGATLPVDANADNSRDYSTIAPLLIHHSEPLRDLARRLMNVSQNQYAETLIKTLGAQAGVPTFDGGVKAVESIRRPGYSAGRRGAARRLRAVAIQLSGAKDAGASARAHVPRPRTQRAVFSSLTVAGRTGTVAGQDEEHAGRGKRAGQGWGDGKRAIALRRGQHGRRRAADFRHSRQWFRRPRPTVTAAIDAIVVALAGFKR